MLDDSKLYKIAEEILDYADACIVFTSKRYEIGELIEMYKCSHPDADLSELKDKHFNHRLPY